MIDFRNQGDQNIHPLVVSISLVNIQGLHIFAIWPIMDAQNVIYQILQKLCF